MLVTRSSPADASGATTEQGCEEFASQCRRTHRGGKQALISPP